MDLADRIREYILAMPGGVSSLRIAKKFLKITSDDESLAGKLIAPILESTDLRYESGKGWRFDPSGEPLTTRPSAEMVGVAAAPITACAVALLEPVSPRRTRSAIQSIHIMRVTGSSSSKSTGELKGKWTRISSLFEGTDVVFINASREASPLLVELARRNLPGPARTRSLVSAVRGVVRIPRGSQIEEIAQLLGCGLAEPTDGSAVVSNIATCVQAALRMREEREPDPGAGSEILIPPVEQHPVLNDDLLRATPASPGTYKFLDHEGKILYVGKSSNLRRRLGEYARGGTSQRVPGKIRKVLEQIHRVAQVRVESAGSDLEAILREAELIRNENPETNVQRRIHPRRTSHSGGRAFCYPLMS